MTEKGKVGSASCPLPMASKPADTGEEEGLGEVTCCTMRVGAGWHLRHLRWRQLAHCLCWAPCQLTGAIFVSRLEKSYLGCPRPDQAFPYTGSLCF